ncbi:ribonuclease HII [Patescibacteria group bacterium]|nr:ribonuclease HII [Patescibacteria group bacterium]
MNKKSSSRPTFIEEQKLWKQGIKYIIGADEVGRGSFAGPVVVGAVVLSKKKCSKELLGQIDDSKRLKQEKREELSELIKEQADYWTVATVGVPVINKVGIGKATEVAFRKAVKDLRVKIYGLRIKSKLGITEEKLFLLIDGFEIKHVMGIGLKNQKAIVKGDQKSLSIAAASIIAKVYRDNLMQNFGKKYPEYCWDKNKGYGTKLHRDEIKKRGLTKLHRTVFCRAS